MFMADANIASQLKHNHEAMVQLDDELKRLQARRTQLEEQHQALIAMLSNNTSPDRAPANTLNLSSECVLLLVLMMVVLVLLYFGSWGPLVVSGIGTMCIVITLRRRRKRAPATAAHKLWAA
jgi:hypothetical protein